MTRNLLNDLRVTLLCSTGMYISDIYAGAAFAKKLKIPTHTLCSNLSLVGNQFTALNSVAPTWDLSPIDEAVEGGMGILLKEFCK